VCEKGARMLKKILLTCALLSAPATLLVFYFGLMSILGRFGLPAFAFAGLLVCFNALGVAALIDKSQQARAHPKL
jgi:hypothetical protein